jgi:hypothetical protein
MPPKRKLQATNVNEEDARQFVGKLVSRIPSRRWIFVPTRPCDAAAINSLCTIANQPYATIEFIMRQAKIFSKCSSDSDSTGASCNNKINKDMVAKLVGEQIRRKLKTDWIVAKAIGLDNEESIVLFFIRCKPRANDGVPGIIPQAKDHAHAITTPIQKLAISAETESKLMSFMKSRLLVDADTPASPRPKQMPRIDECHTTVLAKVSVHPSPRQIEMVLEESEEEAIEITIEDETFPTIDNTEWSEENIDSNSFETTLAEQQDDLPLPAPPEGGRVLPTDLSLIETGIRTLLLTPLTTNIVRKDPSISQQENPPSAPLAVKPICSVAAAVLSNVKTTLFPPTPSPVLPSAAKNTVAVLGNSNAERVVGNLFSATLGNDAINLEPMIGNATLGNELAPILGNLQLPTDPQWIPPALLIMAENLNFDIRVEGKRPSRFGEGTIELSSLGRATHLMRWICCFVAREFGYFQCGLSFGQKMRIAAASCRLVAYDWGFRKPIVGSMMAKWLKATSKSLEIGRPSLKNALNERLVGNQRGSYTQRIESANPGYLVALFRQAQKLDGNKATWKDYAKTVNLLSAIPDDPRPTLHLSWGQLRNWFIERKGKSTRVVTRPILTEKHKEMRVEWANLMKRANEEHFAKYNSNGEFVAGPPYRCFEDEKFFYISSHRKRVKQLPHQEGEESGAANYQPERVASRRFATKVMFAGVVACPHPEHDFDGKIYLKRVSETVEAKKSVYFKQIVDEYEANTLLHKSWRGLHLPAIMENMKVFELLNSLIEFDEFCLDEDIREALVLRYCTYPSSTTDKKKWVTMKEDQLLLQPNIRRKQGGALEPIKVDDIHLFSVRRAGEFFERDVNCDSAWMKVHMIEMGEAIRKAYHWVPFEQEIELIMDNAGGHGTKDCIAEYENELKTQFNVRIIHQVPRSPETNLLDLGIWCGLQHMVEAVHRDKTKSSTEALARTVINAWNRYNSFGPFYNVYKRWDKVLSLILAANGDNTLVDKARRQLIVPIVMAPPPTGNGTSPLENVLDLDEIEDEDHWFGIEDNADAGGEVGEVLEEDEEVGEL